MEKNTPNLNISDLLGTKSNYTITKKELETINNLKSYVDSLLLDINTTNKINSSDETVISVKSIALIKEVTTITNSLKRIFEGKLLKDSKFSGEKMIELGKEIKKTYKSSLDIEGFLKDYETEVVKIPEDFLNRYKKTVIRLTRAPFENEETTKKSIGIIDDLKANITPKTKLDRVDMLKKKNMIASESASLSYTKLKK